jgi:hypothetical protein
MRGRRYVGRPASGVGLTNSLGDAALHLAFDDHGIGHVAAIVHGDDLVHK